MDVAAPPPETARPSRMWFDSPSDPRFPGIADSQAGSEEQELGFWDFVDVVNPLQHIPVVNTIYRAITGDTIKPTAQVAGGTLFGGPIGFMASVAAVGVEAVSGKGPGEHVLALFGGESAPEGGSMVAEAGAAQAGARSAAASASAPIGPAAAVAKNSAAPSTAHSAEVAAAGPAASASLATMTKARAGTPEADAALAGQAAVATSGRPGNAAAHVAAQAQVPAQGFRVPARDGGAGRAFALAQPHGRAVAAQSAAQTAAAQLALSTPAAPNAQAPQATAPAAPSGPGAAPPSQAAQPRAASAGSAGPGAAPGPASGPTPLPKELIADAMMAALSKYENSARLGSRPAGAQAARTPGPT
ncbi:hypothetical protein [Arenibaculum pallidiluteum]|uniref:hypothetical protein n=1 Tax=Arenibaculum pallidiluteum TaxID=2812559 RepID=UPI001A95CE0E|nr:hypothetical protein [Arenibaculum pallidiluteum]